MDQLAKLLAGTAITSPWSAAAITDSLQGSSSGSELVDAVVAACAELHAAGHAVSPDVLISHPRVRCKREVLVGLMLESASPSQANQAASLIHARSVARQLAEGMAKAKACVDDATRAPTEQAITMAIGEAERIVLESLRGIHGTGPSKLTPEAEEIIHSIKVGTPATRPVPTGLMDLDAIFDGGLRPGEVFIVAARPGVGKSTFALQMAAREAMHEGKTTLFVSMEMSRLSLTERLAATFSGVSMSKIRSRMMSEMDEVRVTEALSKIGKSAVLVDHSSIQTAASICSAARRIAKKGLSCVFVDYIQLVRPAKERDRTRAEEVGEVSSALKGLAVELEIPVVAASQLSRAGDTRGEDRPRLSHLRDSGCLEQDSDVVMFLHRPDKFKNDVEAIVDKNRNGRIGMCKLLHQPDLCRFVNQTT